MHGFLLYLREHGCTQDDGCTYTIGDQHARATCLLTRLAHTPAAGMLAACVLCTMFITEAGADFVLLLAPKSATLDDILIYEI